jgi:hypothetical protein
MKTPPEIPNHDPDRFFTVDGLDDPNVTNGLRAKWATNALNAFISETGQEPDGIDAIVDLISGLMHLGHQLKENPFEMNELALSHFIAEASSFEF